jgi:hypothetical protein
METVLIAYALTAIACGFTIYSYTMVRKLKQAIPKTLAESIKTLTPGNRYIITLPSSMTEQEFNAAFDALNEHLDLTNSDTHVVIMHGDIRIVEFS